jgi:hypothetical protein
LAGEGTWAAGAAVNRLEPLRLLVSAVVVGLLSFAVAYFLNRTFAAVLAWTGLVLFFFLGVVIVLINRR